MVKTFPENKSGDFEGDDIEKDSQFGYRGIENRDGLLMNADKHEDLPVFDGEDA